MPKQAIHLYANPISPFLLFSVENTDETSFHHSPCPPHASSNQEPLPVLIIGCNVFLFDIQEGKNATSQQILQSLSSVVFGAKC